MATKKQTPKPEHVMRRTCGAMQVYHAQLEAEPGFRQRQISLEHATTMRLRSARAARSKPYKLTVVVHVVYATAVENISTAQVNSQITALNRDYRAKNPDRSKTPAPWKRALSQILSSSSRWRRKIRTASRPTE